MSDAQTRDGDELDYDEAEKIAPSDREKRGPFDAREQFPVRNYLDFGAIRVPAIPGLGARLEVDQQRKLVISITLTLEQAGLQVQAFSAPRSAGLWRDLVIQIEEQAKKIEARVTPSDVLEGALRFEQGDGVERIFLGVDGPRWFLRGVISGTLNEPSDVVNRLVQVYRSIVIDRGTDPRPPGELLPLKMPAQGGGDLPATVGDAPVSA